MAGLETESKMHVVYLCSRTVCIQFKSNLVEFKFDTTRIMLIQCFENSTFRVIMNWSGPVTILFVIGGSVWVRNLAGRVGSEKMDISGLSVCLSVRMTNVET